MGGRLLCQLAKSTGPTMAPDLHTLPGSTLKKGIPPLQAGKTIIHKLEPLSPGISIHDTEESVEEKLSDHLQVWSRFVTTTIHCRLDPNYEDCVFSFSNLSNSIDHALIHALMAMQDMDGCAELLQVFKQTSVFFLEAKDRLYAWMAEEDIEKL